MCTNYLMKNGAKLEAKSASVAIAVMNVQILRCRFVSVILSPFYFSKSPLT